MFHSSLRAAAYCGPIAPLLVKQAIEQSAEKLEKLKRKSLTATKLTYEGWNFNSGNYLFTTDTK